MVHLPIKVIVIMSGKVNKLEEKETDMRALNMFHFMDKEGLSNLNN